MTKTLDEILAEAEEPAYHRVAVARVLLRQDLIARHAELQAAWEQAVRDDDQQNRTPQAPALVAEIEAVEQEMRDAEVEFRFRSIGNQAWAKLIGEHPPTKAQKAADPRVDHNPETFPVAAIAASASAPEMTVDAVRRLESALNNSQFRLLWAKCLEANIGGLDLPKSPAPGLTRRSRSATDDSAIGGVSLSPSSEGA